MSLCNDPKCLLIREGIIHEDHDDIAEQNVVDPCNQPRCILNRAGIRHNVHDQYFKGNKSEQKDNDYDDNDNNNYKGNPKQDSHTTNKSTNNFEDGQDHKKNIIDDIFQEVLKELDRQYRQRKSDKQASSLNASYDNNQKTSTCCVPAENIILAATTPFEIFGVPEKTTCATIKSRYRDLAKAYDPSKGIINKSDIDKQISNKIMTKINGAYLQLNEIYGCKK